MIDVNNNHRIRFVAGLVAILLITLPVFATRPAGTVVKVFHLQNISVRDAVLVVQPILSGQGSYTVQPSKSRLTVQDRPEIVEKVTKVLASIDRLPGEFWLQVELLEGRNGKLPERLRADVDSRLKQMFSFEAYQRIGSTRFEGVIGEPIEADLGSDYHLSFVVTSFVVSDESPYHIATTGERLVLQSVVLEHVVKGRDGKPVTLELVRSKVVLSENQEAFIVVAGSEESESGVVLILKSLSKEER